MKQCFNLLFLLFCVSVLQAQIPAVPKILFVGNSYTASHNLAQRVQELAVAMGDSLVYDVSAFGGYTFNLHSTNTTTLSKIQSNNWDYVVLQEQSQIPALSPAYVSTNCFPYAHKLDSIIVDHNPCAETVFFMTWGRKNGDAMNCGSYPPVCTYNGMQARLRQSYLQMAVNEHASVAPIGAAWKMVRDSFPSIELYEPDESHPSEQGTYLAMCVLYCTFFHKSCVGSPYIFGSVTPAEALQLQYAATRVTLDSLVNWQGMGDIPHAKFIYSLTGSTVTLTNQSANATHYLWNFGDSFTSTLANPVHTYSSAGTYIITLQASDSSCKAFTATDTLTILPTHIARNEFKDWKVYPNPVKDVLYFETHEQGMLEVYNLSGQKVYRQFLSLGKQTVPVTNWDKGNYLVVLRTDKHIYKHFCTKVE
jgi:hypothetical protein